MKTIFAIALSAIVLGSFGCAHKAAAKMEPAAAQPAQPAPIQPEAAPVGPPN